MAKGTTKRKPLIIAPDQPTSLVVPPLPAPVVRKIEITAPEPLRFLFEKDKWRYKVAWGGRGGAKSHTFAKALLVRGMSEDLRVLCTREIQKSISESVHQLLEDQIKAMGLEGQYDVLTHEIRGRKYETTFVFSGLREHSVESIKSYEGIDVCWVEEAQGVSRRSWQILTPTIRKPNSEIWVSLNPEMETDETYQRFIVSPPPKSIVVKINWSDNPWFPDVLNDERLHCKRTEPEEDYLNIWEGVPRSTVFGAIYSNEMRRMEEDRRIRGVPYDPRYPVHTVWDLGWNDKMVVIMFQKPDPTTINIINYYENNFVSYAEVVEFMNGLKYTWGYDYLPHDGRNKNAQTKKSAEMVLRGLGRRHVRIIDRTKDKNEDIRQSRMLFPRIYVDDADKSAIARKAGHEGAYVGGRRLVECLRRAKRNVPTTTNEPREVTHDEYSHGLDAFLGLGRIADKVRNPSESNFATMQRLPEFEQPVPGMGVLGG